jgi:hypothetical protein
MKLSGPALLLSLLAFTFNLTTNATARDVVLPAGTLLRCTVNEPNFSTNTASVGDPVLCNLHGMVQFGQQAFPRGSYLVGHLEAAKDPGHFFGKGYLDLHFDRIGVPSGDMPLEAKVIAAGKYKVDREGRIRGKGHAKRDVAEWMLPPLWPWKVIMLPARGPRPALKGETAITLRLMDDVELAQVAETFGPGWHFFGQPQSQSYHPVPGADQSGDSVQLATRSVPPAPQTTTGAQMSYATYASNTATLPDGIVTVPGMPVFVLNTGSLLCVSAFGYQDNRITYTLASGGTGVISADEVDWPATTRLNARRGVRVTLHAGHITAGTPGL